MTEDEIKKLIRKSNWKPEIEKYNTRDYSILNNRQRSRYYLKADNKHLDKYSLMKGYLYHKKGYGTFVGKHVIIFEGLPLQEAIKKADEIVAADNSSDEVVTLVKPTKEQFHDYVRIQTSGVTNMLDVKYVCDLSKTGLTRDILQYIYAYYPDLAREYGRS